MQRASSTEQTSSIRSGIFVEFRINKISSPVGAEYAAPTELGKLWRCISTKMSRLQRWLVVKPKAVR